MIEIHGLQKVIDQSTVLDIGELIIPSGEIAALIGPVDSGIAPLMQIILGRSLPTLGTLTVDGIRPQEKDVYSQSVGVLFLENNLYSRQTARQNLAFHAQLYGLPHARLIEVLTLVGLADRADTPVDKLSSGLARRLAFGRAMLHRPQTLVLAEPFARCDEASISLIANLLRQEARKGTAVLILADDPSNLHPVCDTVYILNQGKITETYRPGEDEQPNLPFKIPVRMEGKVALVNPVDILYADAAEGRAYIQTIDERLPTQFTLGELEERLVRSGFFRAHRSYLVNLQHVTEVIPFTRNSFSLRLDDTEGTIIPLSKTAAGELRELLGY